MSNIVLGSKVIVTSSLQVFTQAERAFKIFIILLSLVTILGIQKEHVSVSCASSAIEFLLQVYYLVWRKCFSLPSGRSLFIALKDDLDDFHRVVFSCVGLWL